jgi:hypothetical protein
MNLELLQAAKHFSTDRSLEVKASAKGERVEEQVTNLNSGTGNGDEETGDDDWTLETGSLEWEKEIVSAI